MKKEKVRKIEFKFITKLLDKAIEDNIDHTNIVSLILLTTAVMSLDEKDIHKLLLKSKMTDPHVLAELQENGHLEDASDVIQLLKVNGLNEFSETIIEALDMGVLSLKEDEARKMLVETCDHWLPIQRKRFALSVCERADSKKLCGKILATFTEIMTTDEAVSFIYDIINLDYFSDLKGKFKHFFKQLPPAVKDELKAYMDTKQQMDADDEIIDSDEDEYGNLKGFVEHDIAYGNRHEEQDSDSDSDNDSDGNSDNNSSNNRSGSEEGDDNDVDESNYIEEGDDGDDNDHSHSNHHHNKRGDYDVNSSDEESDINYDTDDDDDILNDDDEVNNNKKDTSGYSRKRSIIHDSDDDEDDNVDDKKDVEANNITNDNNHIDSDIAADLNNNTTTISTTNCSDNSEIDENKVRSKNLKKKKKDNL